MDTIHSYRDLIHDTRRLLMELFGLSFFVASLYNTQYTQNRYFSFFFRLHSNMTTTCVHRYGMMI